MRLRVESSRKRRHGERGNCEAGRAFEVAAGRAAGAFRVAVHP